MVVEIINSYEAFQEAVCDFFPLTCPKRNHNLRLAFCTLQINSGTPIVIDFWAEWCPPCKAIAPIFEKLSSTAEPDVKFYKVNIDEQDQIAKELNVTSVCLPIMH